MFQVKAAWPTEDERITEVCLVNEETREVLQCCLRNDAVPLGDLPLVCTFDIEFPSTQVQDVPVVGVTRIVPADPSEPTATSPDSAQTAVFRFPPLPPTLLFGELESAADIT